MSVATSQGPRAGNSTSVSLPDARVVAVALLLLLGGAGLIAQTYGGRQSSLFVLGAALGLVLFHATFGFASSWRQALIKRRGAGLRAQMLMIALASLVFLPVLAEGSLFGRPVSGAIAPVGLSVLVGSFLFGLGMQFGGGCASGTLYTVGGGSTRMVVVLVFFMIGSLIGTAHLPWWLDAPTLGPVSFVAELGLGAALGLQLFALAVIAALTLLIEPRPGEGQASPVARGLRRALQGPWPLLWGAVLLAVLNVATLALAGHPWTVSFGYALWGAKIAGVIGLDVAAWDFWTWRFPKQALQAGLFETSTSTMNFGIILGAFLAAGLAGRFRPIWRLPWGPCLPPHWAGCSWAMAPGSLSAATSGPSSQESHRAACTVGSGSPPPCSGPMSARGCARHSAWRTKRDLRRSQGPAA